MIRQILLSLAVLCTLLFSGCANTPGRAPIALINRILDDTLPPTFTGPARIVHKNPYVDLTIEAGGLRKDPLGWHWDWLTYYRGGRVSYGAITLGQPPPAQAFWPTPSQPSGR